MRVGRGTSRAAGLVLMGCALGCQASPAPESAKAGETERAAARASQEDARKEDATERGEPLVAPREAPQSVPLDLHGKDTLFVGKVGNADIMMELRVRGTKVGGRYYYQKYKRSILLQGTLRRGRLSLTEFAGKKEEVFGPAGGVFEGELEGRTLSGNWTSQDGEKSLKWSATNREKMSYHDLRVTVGLLKWSEDRSFAYRTVEHYNEHLVFCSETAKPLVSTSLIPGLHEECFHFFEGERGFRANYETNEVRLEKLHEKLKGAKPSYAREIPKPGEGWGGESRLKVLFAKGRVLSFEASTSGLYTAAYPNHDIYGFTMDLRTGERMTLEGLLEIPDNDAFMGELERVVPANPIGEQSGESCLWSDPGYDSKYLPITAHLTDKGLHLTPQFPHVMKVCQYENVGRLVPEGFAKKYARKGALLDQVLKGNWGP